MEKLNGQEEERRDERKPKHTRGLLIGKFMPLHLGHKYLIEFAKNYCDELNVLVCSIKSEPISAETRLNWVKKEFPDVNVIAHADENPQEPKDHPLFWQIWEKSIKEKVKEKIDFVFASEDYGLKLAQILDAKFIPVDPDRSIVNMSATRIRKNPIKHWKYLTKSARPYFVKRICIFGPESTGKSTLAKKLARKFNTVYADEYARTLLELNEGKCEYEDIEFIAKGQIASEDALAKEANKVLICDTDLITTTIWSDILFGKCPEWIAKEAEKRKYDLYLLLDSDVKFVPDKQRYLPNDRQLSVQRCIDELEKRNKKYILIRGNYEERFKLAVDEIIKLIDKNSLIT